MNQKGFATLVFIIGIIAVSGGIVGGSYYLKHNTSFFIPVKQPSLVQEKSSSVSAQLTPITTTSESYANPIKNKITLADYKVTGPTIVQEIYPTDWANVGGQTHNSTQFIITAVLYIPEEDDYSISSSFNHTGAKTIIDDIEGKSHEATFHLTKGNHNVIMKFVNSKCLDDRALHKIWGTEADAKPRDIYFAVRRKSVKQTIKNYTMFDNPVEFRVNSSQSYKLIDLYIHCK